MRERRKRVAMPKPAEPTFHCKPQFCRDDSPAHVALRKATEVFIKNGGTIQRFPPQTACLLETEDAGNFNILP